MRSKEEAHDYRYFPDPDLPPLRLDRAWLDEIATGIPELPAAREHRYMTAHGLPEYDAQMLAESPALGDYFEAAVARHADAKRVANWILTEVLGRLNELGIAIERFPVPAAEVAALLDLVARGSLSGKQAKEAFGEMVESGLGAAAAVAKRGLVLLDDEAEIREHVAQAVEAHPEPLAQYLAGKEAVLKFFMGEIMKRTRGQVPPERGMALLREELERRRGA